MKHKDAEFHKWYKEHYPDWPNGQKETVAHHAWDAAIEFMFREIRNVEKGSTT